MDEREFLHTCLKMMFACVRLGLLWCGRYATVGQVRYRGYVLELHRQMWSMCSACAGPSVFDSMPQCVTITVQREPFHFLT